MLRTTLEYQYIREAEHKNQLILKIFANFSNFVDMF